MTYTPVSIAAGLTSGDRYVSVTRAPDNRFYVAYYDFEQSPKATRLKYSDDEGATWVAEDFSQAIGTEGVNDGGSNPSIMCDTRGNIWLATDNYDGNNKPTVIFRDPQNLMWGSLGLGGLFILSNDTSVTDFICKLDSFHRYGGGYGYENICGVYIKSGAIKYADLFTGAAAQSVDSTGTPAEPRLAVSSAGVRWIAFRDGAVAYMRSLEGRTGSWSARVQVSQGGETVLSVEDIAIHPTRDTPCVIYRINDGGAYHLMLAEYRTSPFTVPTWDHVRVWNGANEDDFYTGCKLAFDARGSVFVYALNDKLTLGKPENCLFSYLRAHNWTAWTMYYYTGSAVGSIPEQIAFYDLHPDINGVRINVPYQNALCFSWLWIVGAPTGDEVLYWINFDRHDNAAGSYPTIFSKVTGDQQYREDPSDMTAASVAFDDEGTPSGTFPGIKSQVTFRKQRLFKTSIFKTESNYTIRISTSPSGRSLYDVEFVALTLTQLNTLETFLRPRQKARTPFYYSVPPNYAPGSEVVVKVLGRVLSPRKVGPNTWSMRFQLLESK